MLLNSKDAKLLVRDVFHSEPMFSLIVEESTPLKEVIIKFAEREELRGIFVINKEQRLTGVITRSDLLIWTRLKFGLKGSEDFFQWRHVFEVAQATMAKDICCKDSDKTFVHPDTPLEEALMMMQNRELIDIPVVDKEGRILGDVHLSDILAKILKLDISKRQE